MPHPYRVRASVVTQGTYGPSPSRQERSGPSPLVDVCLVESGLSASTPTAPTTRNQRLAAALRTPVTG